MINRHLLYIVILFAFVKGVLPQSPLPVQDLVEKLPRCSVLRKELLQGIEGRGIDEPYMKKMRDQGIERALFEVSAVLQEGQIQDVHVVRRLFFREFDAANSQIDEASLTLLKRSGLEADLDEIARDRVISAPRSRVGDFRVRVPKHWSSFVEFLSSPFLQEQKTWLFPRGQPEPLSDAVVHGDAFGTRTLLASHKFGKEELNRVLLEAVLNRYDNSTIIAFLLDAGADINAKTREGTTPLMNAVPHPCNIRVLLDRGANIRARDKWGRTALEIARAARQSVTIHLLEDAGAAAAANSGGRE